MSDFEKFKEQLSSKEKFYSSLTGKKMFLMFGINLKRKMKDYHDLYLKCDILLLPDVFEKFRNSSLSDYQLKISDLYNIPIGNVKKLVPNFFDKEKYVIHYENLQLYLRLGLKLKKMYCVLEFNQSQ